MAGRLEGKSCVITGAGSGMGRAMAELFAAEGAKLVLADISGNQEVVARALGKDAVAVHCDVTVEEDVLKMIETAEDTFGRLDVLCNNAGFGGALTPLHEQTTANWDRLHDINLRSVFFGMKYGIISMLKSGGGAIVNTTSAAAVVGWKHHAVYGATSVSTLTICRFLRPMCYQNLPEALLYPPQLLGTIRPVRVCASQALAC